MKRRLLIAPLIALLALAGCGSERDELTSSAFKAVQNVFARNNQPPLTIEAMRARLTPELRAQIGVPVLIVEIPKQKVGAVVVYVTQNGNTINWQAPDKTAVYTKGGMITGTRGIGFDLMTANVDGPLSVVLGKGDGVATRVHRHLDGENQEVVVRFECTYVKQKDFVTESCETKGKAIENYYWLTKQGEIHASRQWIGERNGYVLTEGPL